MTTIPMISALSSVVPHTPDGVLDIPADPRAQAAGFIEPSSSCHLPFPSRLHALDISAGCAELLLSGRTIMAGSRGEYGIQGSLVKRVDITRTNH